MSMAMMATAPETDEENQKKIEDILKPLIEKKELSFEHRRLLKDMLEMDRRFRAVKTTFSEAFTKIIDLEKKIQGCKEKWQVLDGN